MKTPKGDISDSIIALANDEALLQKMSECKSPEEVYALVKDQVGIPFEQFTAEMTVAQSYLKEMEAGLLSDDDLDAVAGGKTQHPNLDGPGGYPGYTPSPISPIIAYATYQATI
ncbi:MAG TPA: hypothetical protein GX734_03520 [Clostridiaceae bacterium]|nr:hypothetical protein [Clostridiaceae bacterium]